MANLIILKDGKKIKNLNEEEIHPEEKIEKLIKEGNLLPDVYILGEQVRTSSGEDRIDLLGLDSENNVIVIEVKDEIVDENVISQVLKYALWAEKNPDSIKSIWLEKREKPAINFDWDNLKVKIIIVAPSFKPIVRIAVNRIYYPVELVEFKKFSDEEKEYIFLNEVELDESKEKTSRGTEEYNEEFYIKNYNPESAKEFWKLCAKIEEYVKKRGWNLTRKNTKQYVSFKYGFFGVFGVAFINYSEFCLSFNVPKEVVEKMKIEGHELYRYQTQWKQALYKVDSSNVDLQKFEPLFEAAYRNITGRKQRK